MDVYPPNLGRTAVKLGGNRCRTILHISFFDVEHFSGGFFGTGCWTTSGLTVWTDVIFKARTVCGLNQRFAVRKLFKRFEHLSLICGRIFSDWSLLRHLICGLLALPFLVSQFAKLGRYYFFGYLQNGLT